MSKTVVVPTVGGLTGAGIPREIAEDWIRRVHSLQNDCGCVAGATGLIFGFILCIAAWVSLYPRISLWFALLLCVLLPAVASGIGKFAGVAFARLRLRRLVRQMRQHLSILRPESTGWMRRR
jgi:hypothetical protein